MYIIPYERDYFIDYDPAICPRFAKALADHEKSPENQAITSQHIELLQYVEKHTGMPIRTITELKDIYDILYIEDHANKTCVQSLCIINHIYQIQILKCFFFFNFRLPEWTRPVYPGGAMEYLSGYWLKFITGTAELKRIRAGFLLKEIFDRFKKKTLSPDDRVMWLYSGHDITVAIVLNALGVFEVHFRVVF